MRGMLKLEAPFAHFLFVGVCSENRNVSNFGFAMANSNLFNYDVLINRRMKAQNTKGNITKKKKNKKRIIRKYSDGNEVGK